MRTIGADCFHSHAVFLHSFEMTHRAAECKASKNSAEYAAKCLAVYLVTQSAYAVVMKCSPMQAFYI